MVRTYLNRLFFVVFVAGTAVHSSDLEYSGSSINLRNVPAELQRMDATEVILPELSVDEIIEIFQPTLELSSELVGRRLDATQETTYRLGPENLASSVLGPFGSLFNYALSPIQAASRLLATPFSLFGGPGIAGQTGQSPLPLGDVLSDLSGASMSSQLIYQALSSLQNMMSLPASLFRSTLGLAGLGNGSPTFAGMGLLGLGGLAKEHRATSEDAAVGSSLFGMGGIANGSTAAGASGGIIGTDHVAALKDKADKLTGNLDALSMLMSGGAINPLMTGLNGINAAVNAFLKAPRDALSWLGLTSSLTNTQDTLRRMKHNWNLTPEQSDAVDHSIRQSQGLLDMIGGHSGLVGGSFFKEISSGLGGLASGILRLNGTSLIPQFNFNGLDAKNLVDPNNSTAGLVPFFLNPLDFLMNAFGLPSEAAERLGEPPFDVAKNLPLIDTLNPFRMIASLGGFMARAADINRLLNLVQKAFKASTSLLQNSMSGAVALGTEGSLALAKAFALDKAVATAADLAGSLAASPFSLLGSLNPLNMLEQGGLFGGNRSAVDGGRRSLTDATQKHPSGHAMPHTAHGQHMAHPGGAGASVRQHTTGGEAVYRNHLAADHTALRHAATQLGGHGVSVRCEPAAKHASRELAKAHALVGNPRRLLTDHGVDPKTAHQVLAGTHPATKPLHAGPASTEDAVMLCEIKKQAAESVGQLNHKLNMLADAVNHVATARTVTEAESAMKALTGHLQEFDILPTPPPTKHT